MKIECKKTHASVLSSETREYDVQIDAAGGTVRATVRLDGKWVRTLEVLPCHAREIAEALVLAAGEADPIKEEEA